MESISSAWDMAGAAFGVIAAIATAVVTVYGTIQFIDYRIGKKINSDESLRKLGSALRPMAIFDENESVHLDQGAMALIDKIVVEHEDSPKVPEGLPPSILIRPNRHLARAPLIASMDNDMVLFEAKRGQHFDWRYELNYEMSHNTYDGKRRFRIEVIW